MAQDHDWTDATFIGRALRPGLQGETNTRMHNAMLIQLTYLTHVWSQARLSLVHVTISLYGGVLKMAEPIASITCAPCQK